MEAEVRTLKGADVNILGGIQQVDLLALARDADFYLAKLEAAKRIGQTETGDAVIQIGALKFKISLAVEDLPNAGHVSIALVDAF